MLENKTTLSCSVVVARGKKEEKKSTSRKKRKYSGRVHSCLCILRRLAVAVLLEAQTKK